MDPSVCRGLETERMTTDPWTAPGSYWITTYRLPDETSGFERMAGDFFETMGLCPLDDGTAH